MSTLAPMAIEDELIRAVSRGDAASWQTLLCCASPFIERWATTHTQMRKRGLNRSPDDVREIIASTLERLAKHEYKNLHSYLEQKAQLGDKARSFDQWLFVCVDYSVQEHLRERYGRFKSGAPARGDGGPALREGPLLLSKRDLHTLAPRLENEERALAHRSEVTAKLTAREIMEYVRTGFSVIEAEALRMCIEEGATYEEIAQALELGPAQAAETLVRKLKERLRVKFREKA